MPRLASSAYCPRPEVICPCCGSISDHPQFCQVCRPRAATLDLFAAMTYLGFEHVYLPSILKGPNAAHHCPLVPAATGAEAR